MWGYPHWPWRKSTQFLLGWKKFKNQTEVYNGCMSCGDITRYFTLPGDYSRPKISGLIWFFFFPRKISKVQMSQHISAVNTNTTRKSSCVNRRDISPAAWQVLALLVCLRGGRGTCILSWLGYPHPVPLGGTPWSARWGYPLLARWGYPHQPDGVPPLVRWGYSHQNVNRQTPVKTVPSPFLWNAVVKIHHVYMSVYEWF